MVLGIDGRVRGKSIPGHIDRCGFRIIPVRHFLPEKIVEFPIPVP
jgi:hypothetical protein